MADSKEILEARHAKLINSDILKKSLQKLEGTDDVTIINISTGSAAGKGENFCSDLVRVDFSAKVKSEPKEFHWVGKFPPSESGKRKFFDALYMGEKETRFYSELMPEFKNFIKESGLKDDQQIQLNFPNCHLAGLEGEDFYFFMENLKSVGYTEDPNKKLGFDLSHCKVIMSELAKFHGVSHAYFMHKAKTSSLEKILKDMELFTRDYVYKNPTEKMRQLMKSFVEQGLQGIFSNAEAIAEPEDDLVGAWQRYFNKNGNYFDLDERSVNLNEFNVLIHNDLWFNNMLFKYESENGKEVAKKVSFVDMAQFCWSSPVTDISYFSFICLTPEFRERHQQDILEHYHSELVKVLKKFGISPSVYSLSQLKEEYERKIMIGLVSSMGNLPAILLPKDVIFDKTDLEWEDTETMMETNIQRLLKALRQHPTIGKRMRGNCLEAMAKGFLV